MASTNALRSYYGRAFQASASSGACLTRSPGVSTAQFSTTAPLCRRKRKTNKDNNKSRGVSSMYQSGPREPLSMSSIPLPKPRDFKPQIKVDPKHGLWGFFPEPGKLLWTPEEAEQHGRSWTVEELRRKSWEDVHALWWVCCKERNRLATSREELRRSKIGFGNRELELRDKAVRKTMAAIKHTLTERFYTWEDAVEVAKKDPEINLEGGDGAVYTPSEYEDEYEGKDDWEEPVQTEASTPVDVKQATKGDKEPA